MNFLCKAQAYLNSVTATVNSLCGMILSDELRNNVEAQYKITVTLVELEQATADFIDGTGLNSELPNTVRISKCKFTRINEKLIKHAEKIQSQNGVNFDKVITALKLENDTLEKETHFL